MIEYEKEGERLRGTEKADTHYINLDRGINYDAIADFPQVSVLHVLGKPEQWREARLAAGKEIKRLAPRAKKKLSRKGMLEIQLRKKKRASLIGGMSLAHV